MNKKSPQTMYTEAGHSHIYSNTITQSCSLKSCLPKSQTTKLLSSSPRDNVFPTDFCTNWINNCEKDHSSTDMFFLDSYKTIGCVDCQNMKSREEIVAVRKAKVQARRMLKKGQKQLLQNSGTRTDTEREMKPDFSLQQTEADFPPLSNKKETKRVKLNKSDLTSGPNQEVLPKTSTIVLTEKSWKPKVKDPIHIDIETVLQKLPNNEKTRLPTKKTDPFAHVHKQVGNILDSDQPTQKRGKVRPDKPKKPSKLKSIILLGRSEKHNEITEVKEEVLANPESELVKEDVSLPSTKEDDDEITVLLENCNLVESEKCFKQSWCLQKEQRVEVSRQLNIHSRKFREYCSNCLTPELVSSVCSLLEKVAQFQDRTFAQNPTKAVAKRRYVAGLSQTNKYLRVKKVKLVVIAPDLERNSKEGGLDEKVYHFKKEAETQGVPCIFGPNRKQLGKAVFKNALVSCVAVLSYEGAEEQFSKMMEALQEAQQKYQLLTNSTGTPPSDCPEVKEVKADSSSVEDVTSTLLATLREELPPAEILLQALTHNNS